VKREAEKDWGKGGGADDAADENTGRTIGNFDRRQATLVSRLKGGRDVGRRISQVEAPPQRVESSGQ
jgi:hypothetical protein